MKQYVVDAFTDTLFGGNPAAVCILEEWLPDRLMLQIADENHLSETAYAVPDGDAYGLRWFTPGGEVDLCGHATLATAYVITRFVQPGATEVRFRTLSGELLVTRRGDLFEMDLPAYALRQVEVTDAMEAAIGVRPLEAWLGRDLLCLLETEEEVRCAKPKLDKVMELDGMLLHLTAAGKDYDCVSRSFGPKCAVPEDPVCGSGHCHIAPYWARRLGKQEIRAHQASARGGVLYCEDRGDRVRISGNAVLYSEAEIFVD